MPPVRRFAVVAAAFALSPAVAHAEQDWGAVVKPSRAAGVPRGLSGFGQQVSCAAPGQCAAVLSYAEFDVETATRQADVLIDQYFGVWGEGVRAPLPASLGTPVVVSVESISCAAVGDCSAVGSYRGATGDPDRPLIWDDASGAWQPAIEPAAPGGDAGENARLTAVSCFVPRSCAAIGSYAGGILLVTRTATGWGRPVTPRLPADAGPGTEATVSAVSCGGVGSCSAVGYYTDTAGLHQGLLLDEHAGRWARGTKIELPQDVVFDSDKRFGVALYSVSCSAPGYCSATGIYPMGDRDRGGLLISRTPSGWARAEVVQPPAGSNATVVLPFAISCAEPAECSAVGVWDPPSGGQGGAMLLGRAGGVWSRATLPPAAPGTSNVASYLTDVSCGAPGDCGAGGWSYSLGALLSETGGSWAMQTREPAGGNGRGDIRSVSCPTAGHCAATGDYSAGSSSWQPVLFTRGAAPKTPSRIEVRAAIRAALAPPPVLGPDGFVASVVVAGAGSERVAWTAGGHVIARGTQAFTRAGRGTIDVALTPQGRALLARGGPVQATGFGVFTPAGGHPVGARRSVTLGGS
ncbi:MAG: hypothetical protein ACJ762_04875 [Solirubrobacteraceae bacterium]